MDESIQKIEHFEGYDIIDKGNGISAIIVPEDDTFKPEQKPSGFFARLLDWFRKSPVTPYAKVRDMADPTGDRRSNPDDIDVGSDGKIAGEIGIKIRF
jgi:hypothetical protein